MAQVTTEQDKIRKATLKLQIHPKRIRNHRSPKKEEVHPHLTEEVILKNEMAEMDWKRFLGKKNICI